MTASTVKIRTYLKRNALGIGMWITGSLVVLLSILFFFLVGIGAATGTLD